MNIIRLSRKPKKFFNFQVKSKSNIVKIDYNDLISESKNNSELIEQAYGQNSLGLIVVKNIPDFLSKRIAMLQSGYELSQKSEDYLKRLEKPDAKFYVGWSKGRQYLDDGHDYMQAMFYARIFTDSVVYSADQDLEQRFTNIWPDIANFKQNYLNLGKAIANCQINLLKHFDQYLEEKNVKVEKNFLHNKFHKNNDAVGMLATYYPPKIFDHSKFTGSSDNWCGWHRDFGLLSGLTHPMYINKEGNIVDNIKSGLIVRNKKNDLTDIKWEKDEIAIQAADALFIYSGGNIISTPHCVKVSEGIPKDLYRMTYVSFFEPSFESKLFSPQNMSSEELFKKDPFNMTNVITKYKEGMIYKDFVLGTFDQFVKQ